MIKYKAVIIGDSEFEKLYSKFLSKDFFKTKIINDYDDAINYIRDNRCDLIIVDPKKINNNL